MGNSLRTSGWFFLGIGILLVIIGGILIAIAVSADEVETQIARGSDFDMELDRSYTFDVKSLDATSSIKIELNVLGSGPVELYVRVIDPDGSNILNRKVTTPITLGVDISQDFSEYWTIKLIFTDGSDDINDVNVRVFGITPSDSAANLCCAGGILPVVGIILIIIGIILVIVGQKREKKKELGTYMRSGERGASYGSSTDSNDRYRTSASYGSTIPGSIPGPTPVQRPEIYDRYPSSDQPSGSYGDPTPAEQRNPYDTRDGIRIGYRDR